MAANGNRVLRVGSFAMAPTARLDLNDNDMIVDYGTTSPLPAIQSLVNAARNNGAWNVDGLTSSAAAGNVKRTTTLGAMEASEYRSIYGATAKFAGESIGSNAVLVKYTYYGDANLSGTVNFDDYVKVDTGFSGKRIGWNNGDFNGDGSVNFDDYTLIDLAFNQQAAAL
jgi:hypothetical protein